MNWLAAAVFRVTVQDVARIDFRLDARTGNLNPRSIPYRDHPAFRYRHRGSRDGVDHTELVLMILHTAMKSRYHPITT